MSFRVGFVGIGWTLPLGISKTTARYRGCRSHVRTFPDGRLNVDCFFIYAALNLIAIAICALLNIRVTTAAYLMCAVMIPAYGSAIWISWDEYNRLNAILAKYPLISLEPRLAFE
jgi:hypothetical protein